jgi:fibronectin type 3 domain-containing protein
MKKPMIFSFLSCLSFFFILMSCQKKPLSSYNANSMPQMHLPLLAQLAVEPLGITNLTANVTSSSITLTWNAASGASSYNIQRSSGGAYSTIGSTSSTSYSDTTNTPGTIYSYEVIAVNASGQGGNSNPVSAVSLSGSQSLTLVSAITNAAGTSQTLTFSWTGITNSNSYTLYQSTTSGQELISGTAVCTTSSTSCSTAITLGTPYYYVLVATNSTVSSNTVASSEVTMPYVTSVNPYLTVVSSSQAVLNFIPTSNLQAPYSVYYNTASFNGGNATTTGGATLACSYNLSPSSTPGVSPTSTGTGTGTGTPTTGISASNTPSQSPTSSNTPSPTVSPGAYSCSVIETSDQMLYFVVVGTLANGATYQSEEASVPLLGNFSITNIIPTGYSATYGNRTLQIQVPDAIPGTNFTVAYKLATDVNYTPVAGTFSSSPITLDFSPTTGLNLYPNAGYHFLVTATNSTGTRADTVSVTSNSPLWYKIPSPVATTATTTYYINSIGNLYGWGSGMWSLLMGAASQNAPYQLTSTNDAMIVAGASYGASTWGAMCLIKNTLLPYCLGYNVAGQVGQGPTGSAQFSSFQAVLTYGTPTTPSATNTPALSPSASPTATYSTSISVSPTGLPTIALTNIVDIKMGARAVLALDTSQRQWGWANNANGQLQYPNTTTQYWAVQGSESYTYLKVGAGFSHSCGLTTNYTIRCWGGGAYGQAGNYNAINTASKVITDANFNIITDFMDISVGYYHNCAIRSDGSVWCWGDNTYLALGRSSPANSAVALPVSTFTTNDALSLTTGNSFTCVLRKNGQVWCWGSNQQGELGLPSSLWASMKLYQIQNWTDARAVVSNSDSTYACALRQDDSTNSLWCWGSNTYSQLGAGSNPTPGFTPSISSTGTPSNSVTPSATPLSGGSPTSTSSVAPSVTSSVTSPQYDYQYVPQYVNLPVM